MRESVLLTIDPGEKGGYAVRWLDNVVTFDKCPGTIGDMYHLLSKISAARDPIFCFIEKQHAFPARMVPCPSCKSMIRQPQGSKSIWTQAVNYSSWCAFLLALKIPYEEISAVKWQRKCARLPSDRAARKRELKRRAQLLYPHGRVTLNTADALMMNHVLR